jgi:hypothetical protein
MLKTKPILMVSAEKAGWTPAVAKATHTAAAKSNLLKRFMETSSKHVVLWI